MTGLVEFLQKHEIVDDNYESYLENVRKQELKQQVDAWVIKYDKWLNMLGYAAQKKARTKNVWEDFKSELILQAYYCIDRYDSARGVPITAYIVSSLWNYAKRNDIQLKYAANSLAPFDESSSYSRFDISSLERAHNVLSLLDTLPEVERMLMKLHYVIGFELKQIDEMMGCSRATTWHRIRSIIEKLQSQIKVSG